MPVEYIFGTTPDGKSYRTLPHLETPVAEWVAGALEVGGSGVIAINRKRQGYATSLPILSLQDTKPEVAKWLQDNLGGKPKPRGGSMAWRADYYIAAGILLDIEPFVVTRRELVLAVRNWWDGDREERVRIAEEMKGYDRFDIGTVDEYLELLDKPAFLAGVLDYKGLIYPHLDKGYIYPRVDVYTRNLALIEAIKYRFGGSKDIEAAAGTELAINPAYQEARDSHSLTLSNIGARKVLHFTQPYLVAQPFEGWDRRLVEERRQGRADEATRIHQFAVAELERYRSGEIFRISSAEDIAEEFGLSPRTAKRRLTTLPEDIRSQREEILRSANRQVLTKGEIVSLVESIVREIQDFRAGKISRLSYNEQWASSAKVGVHIINRHVLTRLPKELKDFRQHLLFSQSTIDRNQAYGNPSQRET